MTMSNEYHQKLELKVVPLEEEISDTFPVWNVHGVWLIFISLLSSGANSICTMYLKLTL